MEKLIPIKKNFLLYTLVCTFLTLPPTLSAANPPIKLLVLIIASDDQPVYRELQKIWRSYMHSDPEHIEAYFIKADPYLDTLCKIDGDTIWARSIEDIQTGIIHKTIYALQLLLPRIMTEFNYILRTNLSSFYIFPRLLNFLQTAPRHQFYAGTAVRPGSTVASGSGYIMSPDIAYKLVYHQEELFSKTPEYDDLIVGSFLTRWNIILQPTQTLLCSSIDDIKNIPNDLFQVRVKGPEQYRLTDDIFIHTQLLRTFYKQ